MVGVFGILAYSVQQRVRDFGVRRALGATTGDVLRLVVSSAAAGRRRRRRRRPDPGGGVRTADRDDAVRRPAVGFRHVRGRDCPAGGDGDVVDRRPRLAGDADRSCGCACVPTDPARWTVSTSAIWPLEARSRTPRVVPTTGVVHISPQVKAGGWGDLVLDSIPLDPGSAASKGSCSTAATRRRYARVTRLPPSLRELPRTAVALAELVRLANATAARLWRVRARFLREC